jgi:DNA-binding CsgD family transcriptional regulator
LGLPEQARAALAQASELFRAVGYHHHARFDLLLELDVVLHYQADRPAELRQQLVRVAEAQTRVQRAGGFTPPQGERPSYLMLAGRWDEARRTAEAILAAGEQPPLGHLEPPVLGWLYREQGEAARASALVAATMPGGPGTPPGYAIHATVLQVQYLAALLVLDAGDLPTACAWLEAHDRWLAWAGAVLGQAEGQLGWVAYHRATGDLSAARRHAEAALAHASAPRQPLALLAAHRSLGELATAEDRHANAQAHLAEALALAEACEAPYERALTLLALGELAATAGEEEGVGTALTKARAILTPLEARPALARADALAHRLATAAFALPFGLSEREAEVLHLVAQGLSDAQVANRLFLSPYTVKAHLRSIYGKTGTGNRAAASRLAAERGLA